LTTTSNFVFSPAGQNSFQIAPNTNIIVASCPNIGLSSSTSKLNTNVMKTPDASNVLSRSSPRSLKHNSKRKLDLNSLIDQMPDQDFVEINTKSSEKLPMTEHQREMRRKISFIPMEVQYVCSILEPTMDSQMSCATTQDAFDYSAPVVNETSKAIIEISNQQQMNSQKKTSLKKWTSIRVLLRDVDLFDSKPEM